MAKLKPSCYIDTGKEMPPVHKSELKIIIDKELTEVACKQMGLKPPVTTLAQRPMSYSANGWVRVNGKWVMGQPIHNDGIRARTKPLLMEGRL